MGTLTVIEDYKRRKLIQEFQAQHPRKPAEVNRLSFPERPILIKQNWFCSCGAENREDAEECWKCNKGRPLW
jgi:hypothetical protein